METQSPTKVTHYAILIGINDYPVTPLQACVRDVQEIKRYLEEKLKDSVRIRMITTSPTNKSSPHHVINSDEWPTYPNVKSAFNEVASIAKPGDYVYVHYSGHGTQKLPCDEQSNKTEGKNADTTKGDLALVLLSERAGQPGTCLWGFELESLLKMLADKRLIISVALDCCFSGSVYRGHEPGDRFLPYETEMGTEHPFEPPDITGDEGKPRVLRDAYMLPSWLVHPSNYAIQTSCGPQENSAEARFNERLHGPLSYILLETLKCFGLNTSHGDINGRMRVKFRGYRLPQTPAFYGNPNQGFFGGTKLNFNTATVPIVVFDGRLELQAGHAQGLKTEDKLVLCRIGCDEGDEPQDLVDAKIIDAKIIGIRAFTADLQLINIPSTQIRTGWTGRALSRLCLQRFPIRLAPGLPRRDELLKELVERSLHVNNDVDEHQFTFEVVSTNGAYEVLDEAGQKIENLSKFPQHPSSVDQIGTVLEQLGRFRFAKELLNEKLTESFPESLKVQIFANGTYYGPDSVIKMNHNSVAYLIVENQGDKHLYVYAYNLGPNWQVQRMFQGSYMVISPQGMIRKGLRMTIPDQMIKMGHCSCKDIVKVIITSHSTSFGMLELPRLGEQLSLGEQPKVSNNLDRSGHKGDGQERWVAMNFPIHVILRGNEGN